MNRKIVLTGGPATGKTSLINALKEAGKICMDEISRDIIRAAQSNGIPQLFLSDPVAFSNQLLAGRIQQFKEAASNNEPVFIDRGIPDIAAYMAYANEKIPDALWNACKQHQYDNVVLFPPWKEIHANDSERYESWEQSVAIHHALVTTYKKLGYQTTTLPCAAIEERTAILLAQFY